MSTFLPNIDFKSSFNFCSGKLDLSINDEEFAGVVYFVIQGPGGLVHSGSQNNPDITDPTETVSFNLQKTGGQYIFGNYTVEGYFIYDGQVKKVSKSIDLCEPPCHINADGKSEFKLGISIDCVQDQIIFRDNNVYQYAGVKGVVTYDSAVVRPSVGKEPGEVFAIEYMPFVSGNNLNGTHVACMDSEASFYMGDNVFVILCYSCKKEFKVQCSLNLCSVICDLEDLIAASDPENCKDLKTQKENQAKTARLISLITLAKEKIACGLDASEVITEIESLLGKDCGCGCEEATPVSASSDPLLWDITEGDCGNVSVLKIPNPTTGGYTYKLDTKKYRLQVSEDSEDIISLSNPEDELCYYKQVISIDADRLVNMVLEQPSVSVNTNCGDNDCGCSASFRISSTEYDETTNQMCIVLEDDSGYPDEDILQRIWTYTEIGQDPVNFGTGRFSDEICFELPAKGKEKGINVCLYLNTGDCSGECECCTTLIISGETPDCSEGSVDFEVESSTPYIPPSGCNAQMLASYECVNGKPYLVLGQQGAGTITYASGNPAQTGDLLVEGVQYELTIEDKQGCTATATVTPMCDGPGGGPSGCVFTVESDYICADGEATLLWTGIGATGNVTITDQFNNVYVNGSVLPLGTTLFLTFTDEDGCFVVKTLLPQCPKPECALTIQASWDCDISTNVPRLTISTSGGTGAVQVTYTGTGSPATTGDTLNPNQTYFFTAVDESGCVANYTLPVGVCTNCIMEIELSLTPISGGQPLPPSGCQGLNCTNVESIVDSTGGQFSIGIWADLKSKILALTNGPQTVDISYSIVPVGVSTIYTLNGSPVNETTVDLNGVGGQPLSVWETEIASALSKVKEVLENVFSVSNCYDNDLTVNFNALGVESGNYTMQQGVYHPVGDVGDIRIASAPIDGPCCTGSSGSILGIAFAPDPTSGTLGNISDIRSCIIVDSAEDWEPGDLLPAYQIEMVILHEALHATGLGHASGSGIPCQLDSIMCPTYDDDGTYDDQYPGGITSDDFVKCALHKNYGT